MTRNFSIISVFSRLKNRYTWLNIRTSLKNNCIFLALTKFRLSSRVSFESFAFPGSPWEFRMMMQIERVARLWVYSRRSEEHCTPLLISFYVSPAVKVIMSIFSPTSMANVFLSNLSNCSQNSWTILVSFSMNLAGGHPKNNMLLSLVIWISLRGLSSTASWFLSFTCFESGCSCFKA